MAIMFPNFGPKSNDSYSAEPLIYEQLKDQLDDSYYVLHSIPWLSSFVHEFHGNKSPIGEIDFLILHPRNGILAIEAKGGRIAHGTQGFYFSQSSNHTLFDPVFQLKRGVFAIQNWIKEKGISVRIGHAYFFPESKASINELPPAMVDYDNGMPINLLLDIKDLHNLSKRIEEIMLFFKKTLSSFDMTNHTIETIISMIVPDKDYSPCWYSRINNDTKLWLKLTEEQIECMELCLRKDNSSVIVSGWPGSGKTIVAIQIAREISTSGKKVLVITFNKLLSHKISSELSSHESCETYNIHMFCQEMSRQTGENPIIDQEWFNNGAYDSLRIACNKGLLKKYDALIIDEGQVIKKSAWDVLISEFENRKIIVMCDAAQAFQYESPVTVLQLETYLKTQAYYLTNSLRMPKKVCERIKLFNKPNYSVINPRPVEDDTLLEIISHEPIQTLKNTILQLLADRIPQSYIVVLKPSYVSVPNGIVPQGVEVESIGKYRGLEKPIVIIYASEEMTDVDFFCSYSRATSRCLVILDALSLKNGKFDSLGKIKLQSDKDIIYSEAKKSLITFKINQQHLNKEIISDDLFELSWCYDWGFYILQAGRDDIYRALIASYLLSVKQPAFITWKAADDNSVLLLNHSEKYSHISLTLDYCDKCKRQSLFLTPYSPSEIVVDCITCQGITSHRNYNFENSIYNISHLLFNPGKYNLEYKKSISPYIYAIGVLIKSGINISNQEIATLLNSITSPKGRVAFIFVLSFISREYLGKKRLTFSIKEVANLTHSWNRTISQFSYQKWQGFVNDAFSRLVKHEISISVSKGIREIREEKFMSIVNAISTIKNCNNTKKE